MSLPEGGSTKGQHLTTVSPCRGIYLGTPFHNKLSLSLFLHKGPIRGHTFTTHFFCLSLKGDPSRVTISPQSVYVFPCRGVNPGTTFYHNMSLYFPAGGLSRKTYHHNLSMSLSAGGQSRDNISTQTVSVSPLRGINPETTFHHKLSLSLPEGGSI